LASGGRIALPAEGCRSQTWLPYFNLQWPRGGLAGAVGWTGQWALCVERPAGRELVLQAGQQQTHLKLLPGESVRTPRILLVYWQGDDRLRGHNLLRRLLLAQYAPRIHGQVVMPLLTQNMWFVFSGGNETTQQNQLEAIARMPAMGLEGYWLDAGWFEGGWPGGAGSWVPRKDHFPRGLRPLGDAAHKSGMKFVLWFEPERVADGSRIAREHSHWLLSHKDRGQDLGLAGRLFNLGDPEARRWMTDYLSKCITDWGIDVYRQDRNFYPFRIWRDNDPPDRQGITEIRHVEGLYAMWDELLERHPGLMIDNANWRCTGPDLEMVMRSAGSWTSSEAANGGANQVYNQLQMAGLSLYVPLHASLLWGSDPYTVRSVARFGTSISFDTRPASFSMAEMKRAGQEVVSLRPLYLGDYYPLTGIDLDEHHWCGWQFDRPDLGQGFALCFRRSASPNSACEVSLRGLDPAATYEVTFAETYDVKEKRTMTGPQLGHLKAEIATVPGSLLVRYCKLGK
jgi:alpha-galactosidase